MSVTLSRPVGRHITAILPALNEEACIGTVVRGVRERVDEVIVVDNGSDDRTAEIAAAEGATVVSEPVRGFGSACYAGLLAATGDVVCYLDADGSCAPGDIALVCDPVLDGAYDLCLGVRKGAFHPALRVANRSLGLSIRALGGPVLRDIGPLRAIRRDVLLDLKLRDRAFAWPLEMVVLAAKADLRIGEVSVRYLPRIGGESKVTGSTRGALRVVRQMGALLVHEGLSR